MNTEEAKDVILTLCDLFPKFNITELTDEFYISLFLPMEYPRVMENIKDFMIKKPYIPTVSEIAAYPEKVNENLVKIEEWKKEADQVPYPTKQQFKAQLNKLSEVNNNDK